MSHRDLGELLSSPLDDGGDNGPRWWPAAVAALVSAVVAFGVLVLLFDDGRATDPLSATTTTAAPTVVEVSDPFPAGYTPIAADLAVKAFPPVDVGTEVLVPLAMTVRRGTAPDAVTPPLASTWETAAGVRSTRVVTDPFRPGALSVAFPQGTVVGDGMRVVELWASRAHDVETPFDFSAIPFDLSEALVHDLGGGATLTIERVELRGLLAEVEWSVEGVDIATVDVALALLLDDGSLLEEYAVIQDPGAPATSGVIRYLWPFGIRVDQDEASTLQVRAAVVVGTPVAADAEVTVPSS